MNLACKDYQEKRNFIRMKVDSPVVVKIDSNPNAINGHCHDLSGGGMLIEVSEVLSVGSKLEVSLTSSHGHNPMLKALAQVHRVESRPRLGIKPCMAGLRILEMLD